MACETRWRQWRLELPHWQTSLPWAMMRMSSIPVAVPTILLLRFLLGEEGSVERESCWRPPLAVSHWGNNFWELCRWSAGVPRLDALTLVSVAFEMMSQQFLNWSNCGCGWKSCTSKILMKRLGRPFFFCYLLYARRGRGFMWVPKIHSPIPLQASLWGIPKHCFCVGVGCAGGPPFDDHKIVPELNPKHSPVLSARKPTEPFFGSSTRVASQSIFRFHYFSVGRGLYTSLLPSRVPSPDYSAFCFFLLAFLHLLCSVHLLPLVAFLFPFHWFPSVSLPAAPLFPGPRFRFSARQGALKIELPNQAKYGFSEWGPRSIAWQCQV